MIVKRAACLPFVDVIGAGAENSFTSPIQCHNDNNITQNQNKHQSDLYAKIEYMLDKTDWRLYLNETNTSIDRKIS